MTRTHLARRGAATAATLFAGCLLLSACSSGSNSGSASARSGPVSRAVVPANAAGAIAGVHASGQSAGQLAEQTADLAPASQSIIYTAAIKLRSAHVTAVAKQVIAVVVAAGGYTADEHLATAKTRKGGPTVTLTLKVPVPSYQNVLRQLSAPAFGTELSLQQRATDVTQQVANVNSLVTSQRDAITALQGLLRRAASVAGLLSVQRRIAADESSLNSLQAQQRALDHETSYATVTMTLVSPARAVRHVTTRHGFGAGLTAGWRALRHATAWGLTALGAALPFLIPLAVLGGLGYAGRRMLLRRRARPTAAG